MLRYLKDLFVIETGDSGRDEKKDHRKLEIAACALLLEIAKADDSFDAKEKERIIEIMKGKFNLSDNEVNYIMEESEEFISKSISLYEFTDVLNQNLNNDEKYQILKYLWEIAYTDGDLDTYEDHYIKKISNNLHLYNKDRIAAKMEVKNKLGI